MTDTAGIVARAQQAFDDAKTKAEAEAHGEVRRRHAMKGDTAEDVDAEMHALNTCVTALAAIDATARARVQLYLARRFGGHYE